MAKKTHQSPEEAKQAILDAAENIVYEVGTAGLRISAVAKKAGMAHPNIIHHFGSRENLLQELALRVGERSTKRVTAAILEAKQAPEEKLVDAMTKVLETAFEGKEGRVAIWFHLSGEINTIRPHIKQIVDAAHQLRLTLDPDVNLASTRRIVLLVTMALIGEVVSGQALKESLQFDQELKKRAHFKRWLANMVISFSEDEMQNWMS